MEHLIGLKRGSRSKGVVELKNALAAQGAYQGTFNNIFGPKTDAFVRTFQVQHIGPDGQYLHPTGVIDAATAWALANPSGDAQRNFLDPLVAKFEGEGIEKRIKACNIAVGEHRLNVKEVPNGSNWGPEIKKYGGRKGWAWCALFVTWCLRQADVIDFKEAGTWNLLQWAKKTGAYRPVTLLPKVHVWAPGNLLIWQHQTSNGSWTRTGHVSMIIAPETRNGIVTRVLTIGGNEGNRVKLGIRKVWETDDLVAIINPHNPYHDKVAKVDYKIISGKNLRGSTTR